MDAIVNIKNKLIDRISNSNDINFLKRVLSVLDNAAIGDYQLSEEQITSIEKGRKDIKEGKIKTHQQVMEEHSKWLKNQ